MRKLRGLETLTCVKSDNAGWDLNAAWGRHQTSYSTFLLPGRHKESAHSLRLPSSLPHISISEPGEGLLEKIEVNFAASGLVMAVFASR